MHDCAEFAMVCISNCSIRLLPAMLMAAYAFELSLRSFVSADLWKHVKATLGSVRKKQLSPNDLRLMPCIHAGSDIDTRDHCTKLSQLPVTYLWFCMLWHVTAHYSCMNCFSRKLWGMALLSGNGDWIVVHFIAVLRRQLFDSKRFSAILLH